MKKAKVSVLMPIYNFAPFLAEAVESVLEQDFQDYELIIVDDASTDDSAEVLKSLAAKDGRVYYEINQANRGMVQNWNYCLSLAHGEYIKFLFGDDKFASPFALGKLVALLDAHPEASIAASARKVIDENSKWLLVWDRAGRSGVQRGKEMILRCLRQGENQVGEPSAVLFRKKQALRGFNPTYRQLVDLEMWFHLLESGDLAYTRERLCCFRQHRNQQTRVNNDSGISRMEGFRLLKEWADRPWVTNARRWDRQLLAYSLRHAELTPEVVALKQRFLADISQPVQLLVWLMIKLIRPFQNLNHSARKRLARLEIR